jgi:hypothetical protein
VLKGKCFLDVEDIKASVKEILTDIPVQDFKNCFEQWLKHREHCKELEGNYFLTDKAEPFLKSCQLCSHSRTSQHFLEPEGSSRC